MSLKTWRTPFIKGSPAINSKVGPIDQNQPHAFLTRTNASLFEEILKMHAFGKKVHFIGDIGRVVRSFESAYHLGS